MITKRSKGKYFEAIAVNFLKKRGFKIIRTNYQSHHKEIDIICEKNNVIHFIEVKGRTSNSYGEITETITNKKRENLIQAAAIWLKIHKKEEIDWQIDFLGLETTNYRDINFTFIKNAISQM